MSHKIAYDSVTFFMNDITSRVVAKSGIHTDIHHLGKIILHSLQDDPAFVMQIDGATGESETSGSALKRSIKCAIALKKLGLKTGDVIVLMGPHHLDLCIPHYAALYLGVAVAAVDVTLGVSELIDTFDIRKPKIVFCQSDKSKDIEEALKLSEVPAKIVTFDHGEDFMTFGQLIGDVDDEAIGSFRPADFDPSETAAYLTSTSGTTGAPKAATLTHTNLCFSTPYVWQSFAKFPTPTKMVIILSPLQWLTAGFHYLLSPVVRVTRLQTSAPITPEHFAYLFNTYRPTFVTVSPVFMANMLSQTDQCDLTSCEQIVLGGSMVSQEIIDQLKKASQTDDVYALYGMSEISGIAFLNDYPPPKGSLGKARGYLEYRLVDPNTGEDIKEANVPGELWLRGVTVFKGYYNNPEETAECLTKDGWLKTGDIFYRDEYWHFFFVERLKSLLKYKNHQVSPLEVEVVIRKHPGVHDVIVTGIPDKDCGDLVVAFVIPKPGTSPKAQEIKDIVKESLTDSKQLRGGVIFINEFPTVNNSSKINRKKLQEMAITMDRE